MTSLPSWVGLINDATIRTDITNAIDAGGVTFASMEQLFQDVAAEIGSSGILGTSRFEDLQTVVGNLASIGASSYVQYISTALAFPNAANANYFGGQATPTPMGNLSANTSYAQFNDLIGTWYLGTNDPSTQLSSVASGASSFSYAQSNLPLFSNGAPSINDISQGNLGDCYLVCGLAEVALQDPGAIEQMIQQNGNGTYAVRFYVNGKAEWVTVDSTLAVTSNSYATPIFNNSYVSYPQNQWVNLIEKAYAELSAGSPANQNSDGWAGNSFTSIGDGGWPDISIAQITGASQLSYVFGGATDNNWGVATSATTAPQNFNFSGAVDTDGAAFNAIVAAFNAHEDVVLNSHTFSFSSNYYVDLMASHAFAMIGYDASNQTIELQNPWGTVSYSYYQYWETDFYVSLSSLAGTLDYFAWDNNVPKIVAPVVTATSTVAWPSYYSNYPLAVSLSPLITVSDQNGVSSSAFTYTFTDEGTTGHLIENGTSVANGQSIVLYAFQLGNIEYLANTGASGVDTISLTVSDGESSTTTSFTIAVPNIVLTAASLPQLSRAETLSAASLFNASGLITSYTIDDSNTKATAGYFVLNGVQEANGTSFTVTATQLSGLTYVAPLIGNDYISVTANYGSTVAATAYVSTVGPTGVAPTLSAQSATLGPGNLSVALSSLITATDNNGLPSSDLYYNILDSSSSGTGGYFSVDGVNKGDFVTLTEAQLLVTSFVSYGTSADDFLDINVTDGASVGYGSLHITTAGPPVITARSYSVFPVGSTSSIFQYWVSTRDENPGPAGEVYTITYTGTAGVLELNGVVEPTGTSFTVTSGQFSLLSYLPNGFGGSDTFTISVTDSYATSAPVTFTISSSAAAVPVVTGVPAKATITTTGTLGASQLFTATDSYGVEEYELEYVGMVGSSGGFSVNGVLQASGAAFYLTPSNLSTLTYQLKSGTQKLYIRASDGPGASTASTAHWGAWIGLTAIAPANPTPVITASSISLANATAPEPLSALVNVVDPNGIGASNFTYTISYTGAAGTLELSTNNTIEATGTPFIVSASDFANLVYMPTVVGGIDSFTITVNDGKATSAPASFSISTPVTAGPAITLVNAGVHAATRGQVFTAATLFTAADATAGASISQYELELVDTGGGYGNFVSRTGTEPNDMVFYVAAADLTTLALTIEAGTEAIWVRANDGTVANPHWGAWSGKITVTAPTESVPVLKNVTLSEVYGSSVSGTILAQTASAPAYAITNYEFIDGPSVIQGGDPAGALEDGGSANASFYEANLSQVSYQANSNGVGASTVIYVRAFDGAAWSNWAVDTITVTNPGPTVTAVPTGPILATQGESFTSSQLFNVTPPVSGATIAQYEFYVSDVGGGYGGFTSGSTIAPNDAIFTLTPAQFSALNYQILAGTETIYMRVSTTTSTGAKWGAWSAGVTVKTTAEVAPVLKNVPLTTLYSGSFTGTQLLSTVPGGNQITQYEFEDGPQFNGSDPVGTLLYEGGASTIIYTSDPTLVTYQSNSIGVAGTTTIYVRAFDGTAWSNWATDTITVTDPGPTIVPAQTGVIQATSAETIPISQLFSVTPPPVTGASIAQYEIYVTDAAGGYGGFMSGTTIEPNDTAVYLTPDQFAALTYQIESGTESIYVRARVGTATGVPWSAWSAAITVKAPTVAIPVLKAVTPTTPYNLTVAGSSLVSLVSSPSAITQYEVLDGSIVNGSDPSGILEDNGSANSEFYASNLSAISFQAASAGLPTTATLYVRAFDGTVWSNWVADTIKVTVPGATVTPAISTIVDRAAGVSMLATDLFTTTVPAQTNAVVSEYQILQSGQASAGGFVGEPTNTVFTVTAAQFSTLTYVLYSGSETIYVRANDSTVAAPYWGAWSTGVTVVVPTVAAHASPPAGATQAIHIPTLSATPVTTSPTAAQPVASPASLITHTQQSLSPLFALHAA